jgi:hypothetical protein
MRSNRDALIAALDAMDAAYRTVAVFPTETLSRTEGQALLARLDQLDQKLVALRRSMAGRLIAVARDHRTSA